MGIAHFHEALLRFMPEDSGKDRLSDQVKIEVGMVIDIDHQAGIERLVRSFGDGFQGRDILGRHTFRMNPQLFGYVMDEVVHQMSEEHDLCMRPLPSEVTLHELLVFVEIACQDTVRRIIVDDGAFCRHDAIGEEKTGTEPMDVAYKDIFCLFLSHTFVDTFAHAACRPVGEGQAQHIFWLDTVGERQTDALGKDLCLAATRRREDEMLPALDIKDFLL